ncbi:MAG: DUF3536 domain-containing protein [bacterium]
MERYLCIHGHFYQPPRENPWLDELEVQDSAKPFHDWNERILAECYAPNAAARIVDGKNRILKISNNYRLMSFNFGPTLLSWMERHDQETYHSILEADRDSVKERNGHGNAIAQVYNHIIMPLASQRDKWIQIQWGIRDFQKRFDRFPEGMWLSETAVDLETLEHLARTGIKFTVLAPHQASRIRKIDAHEWMSVTGGKIDPTLPYRCFLRDGNHIDIFFYDGPISNSIAFEKVLSSGDLFINRLLSGFNDKRIWPSILSVATDGESYGHHYKFGDMALAYVLSHIEERDIRLVNYGQFLEHHSPMFQVEIIENTSWSCAHGIERWRGDCGCYSGSRPEWNQGWRVPLRRCLDQLKNKLDDIFEKHAGKHFKDPWDAFIDYIDLILDRSEKQRNDFFDKHQINLLELSKKIKVLKLMEMQRFGQLMFTSCGWFFDDISGIEAIQILKYASRAIQLASPFTEENIEDPFMEILSEAKSNIHEKGTGKDIYQKEILPLRLDLKKVLSHYAISSLFENYEPEQKIYCFKIDVKDFQKGFKDGKGLAMGKTKINHNITQESLEARFAVLHLGGPKFFTYVKDSAFNNNFLKLVKYHFWQFNLGKVDKVKKNLDHNFHCTTLSLKDLFLDERRKIGQLMSHHILMDFEQTYRKIYDSHKAIMAQLNSMDIPVPRGFLLAAEYSLTIELKSEIEGLMKGKKTKNSILAILEQGRKWQINLGKPLLREIIKKNLEYTIKKMTKNPLQDSLIYIANTLLDISEILKLDMEMWQIQNLYYSILNNSLPELEKSKPGQKEFQNLLQKFNALGKRLNFSIG